MVAHLKGFGHPIVFQVLCQTSSPWLLAPYSWPEVTELFFSNTQELRIIA
jgi:hypothetical protein